MDFYYILFSLWLAAFFTSIVPIIHGSKKAIVMMIFMSVIIILYNIFYRIEWVIIPKFY